MRTLPSRYAAWCRRQGTMQCSPAVVGVALLAFVVLVAGVKISSELTAHRTGLMQVVAGAGAVLACLAAAGLVAGAMRIVAGTPVPVRLAPVTEPSPLAGKSPAVVTAMTLTPEDRADMEAEADKLASGELDFVVTERRGLFELREDDEARS